MFWAALGIHVVQLTFPLSPSQNVTHALDTNTLSLITIYFSLGLNFCQVPNLHSLFHFKPLVVSLLYVLASGA